MSSHDQTATGNGKDTARANYSHQPAEGRGAPDGPLPAGTPAPAFTLYATPDETVSLRDFRGRPVILAFYPADWSPVCSDQTALYNEILPEFQRYDAQLFGISVDGKWCHNAFSDHENLHYPLLADFQPKGEVARAYGVYRDKEGVADRALFVIDPEGIIRWSYVSPIGVNPGANGILQALEALPAKETAQR
jgi:peroxiredoxin